MCRSRAGGPRALLHIASDRRESCLERLEAPEGANSTVRYQRTAALDSLSHRRRLSWLDMKERAVKLSCYLLRGSQRPSDVLRSTDADVRHYRGNDNQGWEQVESLTEAQQLSNRLAAVYRTTSREPSDWQSMVAMWEEGVDPAANDFAIEERQDRGAVFFFNVGNPPQWIAWSFGRAWRYLLRSKLNPRFGVIAALNDLTAAEDEAVFRKLQVRQIGRAHV